MHKPFRLNTSVAVACVVVVAVVPHYAQSQPQCTVHEEQKWRTLTGHFLIGSKHLSVTVPREFRTATATVYMEVSGDDSAMQQRLFLHSGTEGVLVENGGVLRVAPNKSERIIFSVNSEDGQVLCTWQPSLVTQKPVTARILEGFWTYESSYFRNLRDPVILRIGEQLANGPRAFEIGGQPANVLELDSWQVILRDPQPQVGPRSVESGGYAITLRFIDLQVRLSAPSSKGFATLSVHVPKLELWGDPLWPHRPLEGSSSPSWAIVNLNREAMHLLCAPRFATPLDSDRDERVGIPITKEKVPHQVLDATCKVQLSGHGQPSIDTFIIESPRFHRSIPTTSRRPIIRFSPRF